MLTDDKPWRPFVVLLATESELNGRAWRSVLESNGYAVIDADSPARILELAREQAPDVVVLDTTFSDRSGVDICRQLSGDPGFDLATPIVLIASHGTSRAQRLEAYGSGAWELCSPPLDGSALLLKLQVFLRAKQAVDRTRDTSLIDAATGLYNANGLRHRARELAAEASRHSEPLACIAFTPMRAERPEEELDTSLLFRVADRCRRLARGSDVMGRIGTREFALIAPATDAGGAVRMIDRIEEQLSAGSAVVSDGDSIRLRAGYCATPNFAEFALGPMDMLVRASAALHDSRGPRAHARLDGQDGPSSPNAS
ncbi:MAG: response regulator [Gemmatimonadaceae bacterium]|nr:response regulator [Gemmatimonadaceae bacterium]NUQ91476.1 response regulator [Gemmatimonadaceae bacterium]NUR20314.1 response regulator [Gemmatimonadaceae bacterium]NUS98422.1 response regulator [Gemmatimonadaceae bacterium]